MTDQERKELALEALDLLIRIAPPEEHGEDEDCSVLQDLILELGGLTMDDLKAHGEKDDEYFQDGLQPHV